eukprot:6511770-Prymnesium_polylepis.1
MTPHTAAMQQGMVPPPTPMAGTMTPHTAAMQQGMVPPPTGMQQGAPPPPFAGLQQGPRQMPMPATIPVHATGMQQVVQSLPPPGVMPLATAGMQQGLNGMMPHAKPAAAMRPPEGAPAAPLQMAAPPPAPAPIVVPDSTAAIPLCPRTQVGTDHEVRNHTWGGGERRTYVCTCGMAWNQKRPDKLQPGEDPDVRQANRATLGDMRHSSREYKCGAPKKGHVCTDVNQKVNEKARTATPSPSATPAVVAAPAPLVRKQYE